MRTLALLLLILPSLVLAKDQVYKWVDDKGVVHYTDKPPTENATPVKLPPLQTYKGGTAPPNLQKFEKPTAKGNTSSAQVQVVTPSYDETFRGGERVVPVAVMVTPQLGEGQKLIYLLDGTPQSAPTTDTSFALTGVERGSHTVSVSLVDENGEELGSSTTVTFHVKPPIAGQAQKSSAPPAGGSPPPAGAPKPKPKPP
jgi:hypothetical protein